MRNVSRSSETYLGERYIGLREEEESTTREKRRRINNAEKKSSRGHVMPVLAPSFSESDSLGGAKLKVRQYIIDVLVRGSPPPKQRNVYESCAQ